MRKIIDYEIIQEMYVITIQDIIQTKIKNGWQPYGTIVITPKDAFGNVNIFQAMVKYEDEKLNK